MVKGSKKGQGLPMNVVILAIIVIVVLIIILIILVGGTSQFVQVVRNVFTGRIKVQALDLATEDCKLFCDSAKAATTPYLKQQSNYCTKTYFVELDQQLTKVNCGQNSRPVEINDEEKSKGVVAQSSLGIACDVSC